MPLTPDYRSALDDRKAQERPNTTAVHWASILGFLLSLGALAKAALAIGDMQSDEKGVVCLLLALASLLTGGSLAINLKQRNGSNLTFNVTAVLLLAWAVVVTVRAW